MHGVSELFGTFLKIMQIGFLALTLLLVFFSLTGWEVKVQLNIDYRRAYSLGEAALACPDITMKAPDGSPVRGLFDSSKLTGGTLSCIRWGSPYKFTVNWDGNTKNFGTGIGTDKKAVFPVAVSTTTGVKLGEVIINVA